MVSEGMKSVGFLLLTAVVIAALVYKNSEAGKKQTEQNGGDLI